MSGLTLFDHPYLRIIFKPDSQLKPYVYMGLSDEDSEEISSLDFVGLDGVATLDSLGKALLEASIRLDLEIRGVRTWK